MNQDAGKHDTVTLLRRTTAEKLTPNPVARSPQFLVEAQIFAESTLSGFDRASKTQTRLDQHNVASNQALLAALLGCMLLVIAAFAVGDAKDSVSQEHERATLDECSPASAATARDDAEGTEFSSGSWACKYRSSEGGQRTALTLLLRCRIVSTYEFAYSRVSPEHMNECIAVATLMLQEKPLEEWVSFPEQAQRTFEDHVHGIFERPDQCSSTVSSIMSAHMVEDRGSPRSSFQSGSHLSLNGAASLCSSASHLPDLPVGAVSLVHGSGNLKLNVPPLKPRGEDSVGSSISTHAGDCEDLDVTTSSDPYTTRGHVGQYTARETHSTRFFPPPEPQPSKSFAPDSPQNVRYARASLASQAPTHEPFGKQPPSNVHEVNQQTRIAMQYRRSLAEVPVPVPQPADGMPKHF